MRYLDQMGIPSRDSPAVLLLGDLQIVAYLSPVVSTAVSRIVQLATRQVMLPRNRVAKTCRPVGAIFLASVIFLAKHAISFGHFADSTLCSYLFDNYIWIISILCCGFYQNK